MKPAPIAKYLQSVGDASAEKATPACEISPFRPRTLQRPQDATVVRAAALKDTVRTIGAVRQSTDNPLQLTANDRRRQENRSSNSDEFLIARESAKAEEMAARLEEAYARGREEGKAEASAEAAELRAADRAEAERQLAAERVAFQRDEYARLETTLREGLSEIGENVGAAVARILAQFIEAQMVKRAADELRETIERLFAGAAPGLIRIRGPEHVLNRLRERITNLPVEVEYVQNDHVEAVIEVGAVKIATELRPWADLLASLES